MHDNFTKSDMYAAIRLLKQEKKNFNPIKTCKFIWEKMGKMAGGKI